MPLEIEVIIPGKPLAQKRHRTSKNGKRYDPSSGDKQTIRGYFLPHKPTEPYEGLLEVEVYAFFQTPTSWSEKKQKYAEGKFRGKTPDSDNIEKIIFDALNKYIYTDDALIVKNKTERRYSMKPCTVIRIKSIEQEYI
jgi:Holliday junction resolvase RusA-like endonuclease